jgi:hypothetical protein
LSAVEYFIDDHRSEVLTGPTFGRADWWRLIAGPLVTIRDGKAGLGDGDVLPLQLAHRLDD